MAKIGVFCSSLDGEKIFSEKAKELGVKKVDLDELLRLSDVISLHVHANDETKHMINKKVLGKMKNNSYI